METEGIMKWSCIFQRKKISSADSSSVVDLFWEKKKRYWCFFGIRGYDQSVPLCDNSCMLRTFKHSATQDSAGNFVDGASDKWRQNGVSSEMWVDALLGHIFMSLNQFSHWKSWVTMAFPLYQLWMHLCQQLLFALCLVIH